MPSVGMQWINGNQLAGPSILTATLTTNTSGRFSADLSDYGLEFFLGAVVTPEAADSSASSALTHSIYTASPNLVEGAVFNAATGLPVGSGVTVHLAVLAG